MNKFVLFVLSLLILIGMQTSLFADTVNEETVFNEMKGAIPQSAFKSVDDLFKTWRDIQEGKSKAIIIDIRTEAEFDNGHIKDSNNVDSGLVYTLPKKIDDPNTEIWILCRTKHRATYYVSMLYKYGYKNVNLVEKGISGWIEKGYPLVNKYLGEIKVVQYQDKLKESYLFRDNKN